MSELPETILQFGTGRFLRAFVDRFVHQANEAGHAVGRVVVVQSTAGSRAEGLAAQPEGYHVLVRGYEDGQLVDRVDAVRSVSRALVARDAWPEVLQVARSHALRFVVSNATEAGYVLDDNDRVDAAPPATLPAKLTRLLWERFQAGGSPLVMLPCELIERNADRLRDLVLTQAKRWSLPAPFADWVGKGCLWLNSLVDCIVTMPPADHPLAARDRMLVCAEPYALWAIGRPPGTDPGLWPHPAMHVVDDMTPYFLRKVRILNGTHSAMVAKFKRAGFETVQQVMADREAVRWVRGLMYEEIVPVLAYRVDDVGAFADQTFDRLRNPFQAHKLADIAAHHAEKVKVRLQPTHDEYLRLFGRPPRRLAEVLAAVLAVEPTP